MYGGGESVVQPRFVGGHASSPLGVLVLLPTEVHDSGESAVHARIIGGTPLLLPRRIADGSSRLATGCDAGRAGAAGVRIV